MPPRTNSPKPHSPGPGSEGPQPDESSAVAQKPCYVIDEPLGVGATAEVFRAHLTEAYGEYPADYVIAVKRARLGGPDETRVRDAFAREAQVTRTLRHPGIVRTLHFDSQAEPLELLQTCVDGLTLEESVESRGPVPEPALRRMAQRLSGSLSVLHAAGWCHGDVKPANIRLDRHGDPVLLDLGLARHRDDPEQRTSGSPGWMAPEVKRGATPDAPSDLYSLGLVLSYCATGRAPETTPPTKVSSSVPEFSPYFDSLVGALVQVDPEARPAAEEVRSALRRARGLEAAPHLTPKDDSGWPFVGRETELSTLRSQYNQWIEKGSGGLVWLTSPQGGGCSRLAIEFASRLRAEVTPAPRFLRGQSRANAAELPCAAFLSMLRHWLALPEGPPTMRELIKLRHAVGDTIAARLQRALTGAVATEQEPALSGALVTWLRRISRRGPLVLLLDDFDWADGGSIETLSLLLDELEREAILVLVARTSPEEGVPLAPPRHPDHLLRLQRRAKLSGRGMLMELAPWTEVELLELVRTVFQPSAPHIRLVEVFHRRTGGRPGLIRELVRTGLEAGWLIDSRGDGRSLQLVGDPEDLPLPSSLTRAWEESWKQLSAKERLWLQRMAVVGGRIETDFLAKAYGPAHPGEVEQVLVAAVRSGWIKASGGRYRFRRPALRQAIYERLPSLRRKRMHSVAASALEPETGVHSDPRDTYQRAFHLHEAGNAEALVQLIPTLMGALGERAHPRRRQTVARWGLRAIASLTQRPDLDALAIELHEANADASDRVGARREQRESLDKLADLSIDPDQNPGLAGRVYLLHGRYAASTSRYGLARGLLRNAARLFATAGDELRHSESLRRLSAVHAAVGALGDARECAELALEQAIHAPQRAVSALALGVVDVLEDRYEPALEQARDALHLLRAPGAWDLPGVRAASHLLRSRALHALGQDQGALAAADHALYLARGAGERRLETETMCRLGLALFAAGRHAEAEARLREADLLAQEIEDERGRALAQVFLGRVLLGLGSPEARRHLERGLDRAREAGLKRIEAVACALLAEVLLEKGQPAQALLQAKAGAASVEHYGAELADRLLVEGALAMALQATGDPEGARAIRRRLQRTVRQINGRIEDPEYRAQHLKRSRRRSRA